jgi:large subunit ribosomal protein L23
MPKEIHPYGVLLRPVITEKTTHLTQLDKYVFEVDIRANKNQVKEAVELAFNVHVREVNTVTVKGKAKRFGRRITKQPDWKKAIVTIAAGEKIEILEGV